MRIAAVMTMLVDLDEEEITSWVARGWVRAEEGAEGWEFQEIDVARMRLIRDLRRGMGVGEEAMPVVLSLLDQVYDLRETLRGLLSALDAQPEAVKETVLGSVRGRMG
jgi:chaperone modulatory protein CbpM